MFCFPSFRSAAARSSSRVFAGCIVLAVVCGCGPKKAPIQQKPEVDPSTLFLEPVPTATATLTLKAPERTWSGPTRIQVSESRKPWKIEMEDFETADPIEVCISSLDPLTFCAAPEAKSDAGTVTLADDQLSLTLERVGYDDKTRSIVVRADLSPEPKAPPADWLASGTRLYFGRAFDAKPITLTVPMALNVRLGSASDGSRVFTWTADIDVLDEVEISGQSTRTGRRMVPTAAVNEASRHSDAFFKGESIADNTGSLFLSRKTLADAIRYGGAAFHDEELSAEGVLVVTGKTSVTVQADDGLWKIPAVVAVVNGGEGVYIVADDPENPLILSAIRPGYRVRLMAVGRPPSE